MKSRITLAIVLAGALVCALPNRGIAQSDIPVGALNLSGGPATVGVGDRAIVCATNLGSAPVFATIELLNAMNGVVILQKTIMLGSPGATAGNPAAGNCLDSATAPTAIIAVLIARVVAVNPRPQAPNAMSVVASMLVFSTGMAAAVPNSLYIALVPLHPPQPCFSGQ